MRSVTRTSVLAFLLTFVVLAVVNAQTWSCSQGCVCSSLWWDVHGGNGNPPTPIYDCKQYLDNAAPHSPQTHCRANAWGVIADPNNQTQDVVPTKTLRVVSCNNCTKECYNGSPCPASGNVGPPALACQDWDGLETRRQQSCKPGTTEPIPP
jgi:hypothetical protein